MLVVLGRWKDAKTADAGASGAAAHMLRQLFERLVGFTPPEITFRNFT